MISMMRKIHHGLMTASLTVCCFAMLPLAASNPTGHLTYTLGTDNNSTQEGKDAYARIKIAMDSAMYYYNTYTTLTKSVRATYVPSVQTADGNSNGSIRFGSNKSYQVTLTAMHEIAHTLGIGTTTKWSDLTDANKIYTGTCGTKKLKEIDGPNAVLKGDDMHFWPYGLNYASEVNSNQDLINHCLIVNEIYKDLYPTGVIVRNGSSMPLLSADVTGLRFTIALPSRGRIEATLFSLSGRKVASFADTFDIAGTYSVSLDNTSLPPGQYLYRVIAKDVRSSGMMITR